MRNVFLSEKKAASGSRVMDTRKRCLVRKISEDGAIGRLAITRPPLVQSWIEMWDYRGGIELRGFVAASGGERTLYVFVEPAIIGPDLKHALMALMELADTSWLGCHHITVCLARSTPSAQSKNLIRDLGWVGFGLGTVGLGGLTAAMMKSPWLFLSLEL